MIDHARGFMNKKNQALVPRSKFFLPANDPTRTHRRNYY